MIGVTALTVVKAEESKGRVQRDPCFTGPSSGYRLVSSNRALWGSKHRDVFPVKH